MIVQACLNGARAPGFHPALPLSAAAIGRDAAACIAAGAAEIHVHPRDAQGRESLDPTVIGPAVAAVRAKAPGSFVGVSTGEWIERDTARTLSAIAGWSVLPDYASVNFSEPAAAGVAAALTRRGVGIEAGLASAEDVARLLAMGDAIRPWRLLVEIMQDNEADAQPVADAVLERVHGLGRPILLHGKDATVWSFVRQAAAGRFSTRVGLEDGDRLPDGSRAGDNAALVAAARQLMASAPAAAPL